MLDVLTVKYQSFPSETHKIYAEATTKYGVYCNVFHDIAEMESFINDLFGNSYRIQYVYKRR